jgi:hypothetical protein
MGDGTLRVVCEYLRHIEHQIDNAEQSLNFLEGDPMFSHPARKYKAVNLRINMHRIQIEIRDFLKEVKQYEESKDNSDLST